MKYYVTTSVSTKESITKEEYDKIVIDWLEQVLIKDRHNMQERLKQRIASQSNGKVKGES